jgi:hypothetical protein
MNRRYKCLILAATVVVSLWQVHPLHAQAPDVEIAKDRSRESDEQLVARANELRAAGKLVSYETLWEQAKRKSCELGLPEPATRTLTDREVWQRSRQAHVRVGYFYKPRQGGPWQVNVAGAYYITADGAAATCYHVVKPPGLDFKEGYMIAATEDGQVFPVTEVLAGRALEDVAIVRVKPGGPVTPLALNTNVFPGDPVWCYSDPKGRSEYFSKGMVNRFFQLTKRPSAAQTPRIDVSTDWAPGSSGSAVVDACGNAIGHVSEIDSVGPARSRSRGPNAAADNSSTFMIFHYAARAADVLSLVKPPVGDVLKGSEPHVSEAVGAAKP